MSHVVYFNLLCLRMASDAILSFKKSVSFRTRGLQRHQHISKNGNKSVHKSVWFVSVDGSSFLEVDKNDMDGGRGPLVALKRN
jgi:hypothetical protein